METAQNSRSSAAPSRIRACKMNEPAQPVEVRRRVQPCMLSSRRPCRDYDHDCDDMTMEQMCACRASTHPLDDHTGYCVIQQRWS